MAAMQPAPDTTAPPDPLARLNAAQRAAVLHGREPLLIIAGAGTGKTNTLAHRVARMILDGADPRRILLLTFSRRAAAEMNRRIARIAGEVLGARAAIMTDALAWSGTFHAVGARLLREIAPAIGLDPAFTLHDREDSADLMNLVRHELGLSATERRFPAKATCLAIYSRVVNAREGVAPVLKAHFPWCVDWEAELKRLFAGYVEAKQAGGVLDYDDLLLYWAEAVADPMLGPELGARFDHVLVDEYQDTNRLQAAILLGLKPDGAGVTVVGDDAQSIYAFRAAEVRNILDFPAAFEPRAHVVALEQNYRSTQPILVAANAVIAEAREGYAKTLVSDRASGERPRLVVLRDETVQADYVCDEVLAAREAGTPLKAQAVLFRTAHHSGPLEVELTRRNIPFVKFGGLKFLEASHVKDLMATLRFAENPRDRVAGFRVLQLVPGIGPSTAAAVMDAVAAGLAPGLALAGHPVPARAAADWPSFVAVFDALRGAGAGWPGDLATARLWYEPHLERRHEDAAVRRADLLQLEQIAATYPSRERFLTELTLDGPEATSDRSGVPLRDEDYLILSTIHSAKGQEWRRVFVLNCVDGCIPSDLGTGTSPEIEEERRLLYVAMTRAKDDLHLLVPQRFYTHAQAHRGDRHVYAARSRFLPDATLPCFEPAAWPPPARQAAAAPLATALDLKRRMRGMWD
jgi:DNA helicase II / ATP-dependent DNA helicase PcrA